MKDLKFWILLVSTFVFTSFSAFACPTIVPRFVDYNCDQQIKIVFIGDSFVRGIGDTNNKGGYVARFKTDFATNGIVVTKVGIPGATTWRILRKFKDTLLNKGEIYNKVVDADVIIIDAGRNDFWHNRKTMYSITTIKRLIKFLKENLTENDTSPMITVSTLMHVSYNKVKQLSFIKEFNALLLGQTDISGIIRQHSFHYSLLSSDGLHPTPYGYTYIYKKLKKQIRKALYSKMLTLRKDLDNDQIYDYFEEVRYLTNPSLQDTDGDGISDGDEIFVYGTNALA